MIHPRVLFLGDPAAATPWVGVAKKLARACYSLKIANKVYRLGSGVKIRVENIFPITGTLNGISKVWIEASEAAKKFLAIAWVPEGLVLTPRSASIEFGYGFPKRELGVLNDEDGRRFFTGGGKINAPFGTAIASEENECLNQVLINRFQNNKYLDKKGFVTGLPDLEYVLPEENKRLRATIETEYVGGKESSIVYWPIFYYPPDETGSVLAWTDTLDGVKWYDGPGIDKSLRNKYSPLKIEGDNVLYRQFQAGTNGLSTIFSTSLIYEEETESWFCHWPEELLYDNDGYEMVFYMTNQYRAEVGRLPLFREIRGHANMTRMILAECQRAEVMFHNNEELYRQGYKTVLERIYNAGSNWSGAGENLLIDSRTSSFSVDAGEIAADDWRNSPPHYANMISDDWDDPPNSTSHEITGRFSGTATETQYGGEFDPPLSGALWSQLFMRRDYWVMAGNINQTTRHGSISFFQTATPLGVRITASTIKEFYVYFKGRSILIAPMLDKNQAGYTSFVMGAGICKIEDAYYIRVIFLASKTTVDYYVYRKPLFGNHIEDWVEEATQEVEPLIFQYNSTSFDYEGEKAIITRYLVNSNDLADHYFPMAADQFEVMTSSLSIMEYYDGAFSVVYTTSGPELTYTVETGTSGGTTYITRYLQECSGGENGVSIHPFYTYNAERTATELKYLRVLYDWAVDQTRTGYADPVYENSWNILETLVLPSGKEIILKSASADSNTEKTLMVLAEGGYILIFLYIDPVNEDMVYVKINLRGDGAAVYGQATIYADLYDSEELQVIKEFDEVSLDSTALTHPSIVGEWTDPSISSTVCTGIISTNMCFQRDETGRLYPIFRSAVSGHSELWRCVGYGGAYRAYGKKPRTGTHNARLDMAFGDWSSCIYLTSPTVMNFTYPANLKITEYLIDGIGCWATRYKDKFVAQVRYNPAAPYKMWNIPFTEDIVWANFDVSNLVGIGELTDIMPFGAIL